MDDEFVPEGEEFSIEMADFEVRKVRQFDRLWRIEEGGSIDQFPLLYNGMVYFGSFNHNLYCLDARTGKLVWKFKAADRIGITSPMEYGGMVFIGSYDFNMYALDAGTGRLVWKFPTRGEIVTAFSIDRETGMLYFGSKDQNFYALDARSGSLKWKFRTNGEIISIGTIVGGKLIFGSYDKNYYCVDKRSGVLLWKLKVDQEAVNGGVEYAVRDGCVYLSTFDNCVRKVDVETGREVWKKRLGQYGMSMGTVMHGDMILVPARDGILYALDPDGKILWRFSTTKPLGSPTVCNGRIFLTCEDMNLRCLTLEGRELWKFKTQGLVWWKPAVSGGRVYFGSYDCFFYVLEAETGRLVWKFRADGSPSPIVPPHDSFELSLVIRGEDAREEAESERYDIRPSKEAAPEGGFYKSRTTYQTSTRYRQKGKYQSSDDDNF